MLYDWQGIHASVCSKLAIIPLDGISPALQESALLAAMLLYAP